MIQSIRIVRQTNQFEAMRAFYQDQLDMRPLAAWNRSEDDQGIILVFNGRTSTTSVEILKAAPGDEAPAGIGAPGDEAPAVTGAPAQEASPPHTEVSISFEVDNVGAQYETLVGRGVEIVREPANMPWGHRSFSVQDPDGFAITFFQDMN